MTYVFIEFQAKTNVTRFINKPVKRVTILKNRSKYFEYEKIRNESKPPQKLGYLLEMLSLVPTWTILPEKYQANEHFPVRNETESSKAIATQDSVNTFFEEVLGLTEGTLDFIRSQTKQYPNLLENISRLYCLIRDIEFDPEDRILLFECYKEFLKIRPRIFIIAHGRDAIFQTYNRFEAYQAYYRDISFETRLHYTEGGTLSFERDILEIVLKDIVVDRLRVCWFCHRIFLAKRINSFCCSNKCHQNIRGRRARRKAKKRDAERFPSRVKPEN